jgi:hypothetical protein
MRPRLFAVSCLSLLAFAAPLVGSSEGALLELSRTSDLASTPGGGRVGVLLPGAPVRVIETRDGWIRVAVEGWILADDLGGEAPESAPAPMRMPSPSAVPALAKISGSVYVTGEGGKTLLGSGLAVRLVENNEDVAAQIAAINDECHTRRSVLSDKAALLADQAERAMKTISGTSEAFEAYDEAKQRRARTLKEIKKLDAECGEKLEAAVESRTVSRTLTGADGRYIFDAVRPGVYIVHVILEAEGMRHEWDAQADTREVTSLTLDLIPSNRARSEKVPTYR